MTPETLFRELPNAAAAFAGALVRDLEAAGLGATYSEVDHICYRVADLDAYEAYKRALTSMGSLLSEAFINGRPIASYKLARAIDLGDGRAVSVIELPAPKPGTTYAEGFEHIEVVTRQSLTEFVEFTRRCR